MKRRLLIIALLLVALMAAFFVPGSSAQATRYGVDYSSFTLSRLNAQTFLNAGYSFVARYLSGYGGNTSPYQNKKNLTPAEADKLSAGGLDLIVVWETTTGRPLQGYAAGRADAMMAFAQAKIVGMPDSKPVYFAVDTDTTWAKVKPYFQGVYDYLASLHPPGPTWHPEKHVGIYGGYFVVKAAHDDPGHIVSYFWQTIAWSQGKRMEHDFFQFVPYVFLCGVDGDPNRTLSATGADFGQWRSVRVHYYGNVVPAPGSRTLKYTHGQPLMAGGDVSYLQSRLNQLMPEMPPLSGNLGYDVLTKCSVIRFQDKFGIGSQDGVCGPDVWAFVLNTAPGERVIGPGNRGADVLWLQQRLNALGFPCGTPDGIYGPRTEKAVEQFQAAHKVQSDGSVARVTWDLLLAP